MIPFIRNLFVFLCLFVSCSRYTYETSFNIRTDDSRNSDDYINILKDKKQNPKLVLVGFHTYKITKKDRGFRQVETFAELDLQSNTSQFFKNAKYIDSIPSEKYVSVNQVDAKRFVVDYISKTGASGKDEVLKVLKQSPKNENEFVMKKTDADYYVTAIHMPYYHERDKSPINSITGFFGIITLGLIPIYEESVAETIFNVYDKNLKYYTSFLYKRNYTIKSALWMWPNEGFQTFFTQVETPPLNAYKIHVEEFERELLYQLTLKK